MRVETIDEYVKLALAGSPINIVPLPVEVVVDGSTSGAPSFRRIDGLTRLLTARSMPSSVTPLDTGTKVWLVNPTGEDAGPADLAVRIAFFGDNLIFATDTRGTLPDKTLIEYAGDESRSKAQSMRDIVLEVGELRQSDDARVEGIDVKVTLGSDYLAIVAERARRAEEGEPRPPRWRPPPRPNREPRRRRPPDARSLVRARSVGASPPARMSAAPQPIRRPCDQQEPSIQGRCDELGCHGRAVQRTPRTALTRSSWRSVRCWRSPITSSSRARSNTRLVKTLTDEVEDAVRKAGGPVAAASCRVSTICGGCCSTTATSSCTYLDEARSLTNERLWRTPPPVEWRDAEEPVRT